MMKRYNMIPVTVEQPLMINLESQTSTNERKKCVHISKNYRKPTGMKEHYKIKKI